jgi:D-alanyl-D-alanine dipeptidase
MLHPSLVILEHANLVYQPIYARADNVAGRVLYTGRNAQTLYFHKQFAPFVYKAADRAARLGYRLLVADAFRPNEVSAVLYDAAPSICLPAGKSWHNKGLALDLTLLPMDADEPLDMGSPIDDLTDKATWQYPDMPDTVVRNRYLLASIMASAGFSSIFFEWWHWQITIDPDDPAYPSFTDAQAGTRLLG